MLSIALFSKGNRAVRSFLRGTIRLRSSKFTAVADRRLASATAAASGNVVSVQPLQWTRAAADTLVTSARPLAPSDASYDGIAKVYLVTCDDYFSLMTPLSGRNHPVVDRHHRIPSRNSISILRRDCNARSCTRSLARACVAA